MHGLYFIDSAREAGVSFLSSRQGQLHIQAMAMLHSGDGVAACDDIGTCIHLIICS